MDAVDVEWPYGCEFGDRHIMSWLDRTSAGVLAIVLLAGKLAAQETFAPPIGPSIPAAQPYANGYLVDPGPPSAASEPTNPYERGLEAESLPAEIEEDLATGRVVPRF